MKYFFKTTTSELFGCMLLTFPLWSSGTILIILKKISVFLWMLKIKIFNKIFHLHHMHLDIIMLINFFKIYLFYHNWLLRSFFIFFMRCNINNFCKKKLPMAPRKNTEKHTRAAFIFTDMNLIVITQFIYKYLF